MKSLFAQSIFVSLLFISLTTVAQNVDTQKSLVQFTIGNMGKVVDGTFTGMTGDVKFDTKNPANSTLNICIKAATVNTKNERRDNHLKTADFLDTEKYPNICFESTKIIQSQDGADKYVAIGNLTLHGVTRETKVNLSYENGRILADFSINRIDYKIAPKAKESAIGYNVDLKISCVYKNVERPTMGR